MELITHDIKKSIKSKSKSCFAL